MKLTSVYLLFYLYILSAYGVFAKMYNYEGSKLDEDVETEPTVMVDLADEFQPIEQQQRFMPTVSSRTLNDTILSETDKGLDLIENKEELLKEIEEYEDRKRLHIDDAADDADDENQFESYDESTTIVVVARQAESEPVESGGKPASHLTTITIPTFLGLTTTITIIFVLLHLPNCCFGLFKEPKEKSDRRYMQRPSVPAVND